ncbi:MAG: fluoride efflux transporter CrcB [Acidimicrobiaceae bacterium]|nr:fluoride efflux transporter CrcB [Acidimicrobiaceae bacterium]
MPMSIIAICVGACAGALSRWGLAVALNSRTPNMPLGTLMANVIGGFLVGIAVAVFANNPGFSSEWKLLVITGFLGSLTTFSTFSAEVTDLIQNGRLQLAMLSISAHVGGSLAATMLGLGTVSAVRSLGT